MQLSLDPKIKLLNTLILNEVMSLGDLMRRLSMTEALLAESIATLANVMPELHTPPGAAQLTSCPDLIDADRFCALLPEPLAARVSHLIIRAVCESTNTEVVAHGPPKANSISLALSEFQTKGRGRHGRSWTSGFAEGLCMTAAFRLAPTVRIEPSLTLAIGAQVAEAIETQFNLVLLKWPNDLVLNDGKLGGVLVEMSTLRSGDHLLKVGVGINCVTPEIDTLSDGLAALDPIGLDAMTGVIPDRTELAARVAIAIVLALDTQREHGFEPFRLQWQERDYLQHQQVKLVSNDRVQHGVAKGIDRQGALRVVTENGEQVFMSGEVRVRRR